MATGKRPNVAVLPSISPPATGPNGAQSWRSVLVDLALIGAVLYLGVRNVTSAQVWMILSAMVGARFYASGVRRGSGSSSGDPYGDGGGAPGSGDSARRMRAIRPEETPQRPPNSLPRAISVPRVCLVVTLLTLFSLYVR